jgi:hypothetical protein
MAFIVEKDMLFDPMYVGLFDITDVVLESDRITHLVKVFFGAVLHILCTIFVACRNKREYTYFSTHVSDLLRQIYYNMTILYKSPNGLYIERIFLYIYMLGLVGQ